MLMGYRTNKSRFIYIYTYIYIIFMYNYFLEFQQNKNFLEANKKFPAFKMFL